MEDKNDKITLVWRNISLNINVKDDSKDSCNKYKQLKVL